jgi:hypothetical protein
METCKLKLQQKNKVRSLVTLLLFVHQLVVVCQWEEEEQKLKEHNEINMIYLNEEYCLIDAFISLL